MVGCAYRVVGVWLVCLVVSTTAQQFLSNGVCLPALPLPQPPPLFSLPENPSSSEDDASVHVLHDTPTATNRQLFHELVREQVVDEMKKKGNFREDEETVERVVGHVTDDLITGQLTLDMLSSMLDTYIQGNAVPPVRVTPCETDVQCHNHGRCEGGVCNCYSGYYGTHCENAECPKNCYGNGACFQGTCKCRPGFEGVLCERLSNMLVHFDFGDEEEPLMDRQGRRDVYVVGSPAGRVPVNRTYGGMPAINFSGQDSTILLGDVPLQEEVYNLYTGPQANMNPPGVGFEGLTTRQPLQPNDPYAPQVRVQYGPSGMPLPSPKPFEAPRGLKLPREWTSSVWAQFPLGRWGVPTGGVPALPFGGYDISSKLQKGYSWIANNKLPSPELGMTWMFWITPYSTHDTWMVIAHKGGHDRERTFGLWFHPHSTRLHVRCSTSHSSNEGLDTDPRGALPIHQRTHVAVSVAGRTFRVYLNGVLAKEVVLRGNPVFNNAPLYIGGSPFTSVPFNGRIERFLVFNRGLSPQEIEQEMSMIHCPDQCEGRGRCVRGQCMPAWHALMASTNGNLHVAVEDHGELGVVKDDLFWTCCFNVNSLQGWHLLTAKVRNGITDFYLDGKGVCSVQHEAVTGDVRTLFNAGGGSMSWQGVVQDFKLFNRALDDDQVAGLFRSFKAHRA